MKRLINSFRWAGQGLYHCLRKEKNFQLHCVSAVVAALTGFILNISNMEWTVIIICITMVMAAEMINTAIEKLCNIAHPEISPLVKVIKDVMAGAVLLVAAMAAICGGIIFLPKIL